MKTELGTLYGVGVGPGDPGLVTLRAVEVVRAAATVAYPVNREGAASRALDVIAGHLPEDTRRLPLLMPMTRDRDRLRQSHQAAAAELVRAGASGDIACLTLGDPLFYSTFGYLAGKYPGPVKIVSGVTAASAMAAAVGLPLAEGDTPTVVVTGADPEGLAAALELGASTIIIKPRSMPPLSFDILDEYGVWDRACAAAELGGAKERVMTMLSREAAQDLPYFAVMWIRPR